MSFQATRFILSLTNLNSSQKAVAHTLAYHANKNGENSYPSMDTIARESGLQSRRSAQRIVRQLEKMRILVATTAKTGGRGRDKATVYRLYLDYRSPLNSDTTVALSGDKTATQESPFTVDKQRPERHESATPATVKGDIQGRKQRHPGRTKSTEESLRVSEEDDQHQSRVKEPHTSIITSNAHADVEGGIKPASALPDQTSIPPPKTTSTPNQGVSSFKKDSVAAPAPAYGTPEWWTARNAAMSDEEKVLTSIALIRLSNNLTFKSNGKLSKIVNTQLKSGVPWRAIVDAAQHIANTLDECDKAPGLTLEKNLAATIDKLGLQQAEEARNEEWERAEIAKMNALGAHRSS
jgi:helix-turn-helix protein